MEELEDGPGPSSSSRENGKGDSSEAANDSDVVNITLPEQLQKITPAEEFVSVRHRWNTSEEIASILIAFDRHKEWLMLPQKIRPASGSMLLYNRKVVFYRRDGYCWKKRRNGSTIREDHMKLKVQGLECIYGSYVHSAILPTFHRRCYWLLQNPNIVLLHYLNVPYPEAAKPSILSVFSELKQKEWTKEELVDQLRPMLSNVGQNAEEDADEEKKVERILEELLPVLMPSKDGSKQMTSLPHGLGNQTLTPAHTATLNRLIAPRQSSSQLTIYHQQQQTHQPQQQDNLFSRDDQAKSTDAHIQVPLLMKNPTPHTSHKGLNPVHITNHSPYQHILFHLPGDNSSIHTLTSKPIMSESSICDAKTEIKNVSTHQPNDSNINIFSNDSNNFVVQHQNIENHHPHIQPSFSLDTQLITHNNAMAKNAIVTQLPTTSTSHPESDSEMTDSFVNHIAVISKEGSSDSLVVKKFPPSGMTRYPSGQSHPSSLSSLMQADVRSAMDITTIQSQGQMAQQPFQPTELCSKVAQASIQHHPQQQQQQQQNLSQSQQIAQQNHSLVLQNLAQNSHQLHSASQPLFNASVQPQQQSQQQNQTPFLTLHLKSANNSVDNSGFVLSLQGATIVAQDASTMLEPSRNQPQSLNISDSNGVVLIASQNQSGQLVLNRISNNSNNSTQNQISTTAAPGAPYVTASSSSQNQSTFKCETDSSSIFSFSPLTSLQSSSGSRGLCSQNSNIFSPSSMSHMNVLPSLSCPLVSSNFESQQTPGFTMSATTKDQQISNDSFEKILFPSGDNCITQTSSCSSSSSTPFHNPTKDLREPVLYNLDVTSHTGSPSMQEAKDFNKMDMSCSHLEGVQAAHQSQQANHNLIIDNTSNIFHNKETITNPNSCDTLDGSFSSLPTSDLNLDDFLDLHDLHELTGSPLSPVDISTSSPTTSQYCWDSNQISSTRTIHHTSNSPLETMGKARESETSVGIMGNKVDMPPFATDHQHCRQQQPQQHFLSCHEVFGNQHVALPTSPNHPGAPPRTSLSFSNTPIPSPNLLPPSSSSPNFISTPSNQCDGQNNSSLADPETDSVIKDFSPDWAYSKTNTKVLVAGPWSRKTSVYTCVFDGEHILAVLIQPGLLRCFTPFHNSGYCTLQVARDGVIISNCEVFEFCDKEKQTVQAIHPEWFDFNKNKLKLLLMERMDQLQRLLTSRSISLQDVRDDGEAVEHSLVERVESLAGHPWSSTDQYPKAGQHNLTLLHLAAALGWAKFISCLIKWRMENSCVALEFEVDALSVDSHACTPLMWACGLGNIDAALTLHRWNALPLKMCNKDGLLPLSLARQKGHYNLANQIEQLERSKEEDSNKLAAASNQESAHLKMDITSPPPLSTTASSSNTGSKIVGVKREVKEEEEVASTSGTAHSFSKPVTPGPKLIRRFSEQAIGQMKGTLNKRNSVDLLPCGQDIDQATLPTMRPSLATSREATSEPQLPVSPDMAFVASPAPRLLLEDKIDEPSCVYASDPSTSRMDTDETAPVTSSSPIIDVERISSDEEIDQGKEGSKHQMVTLANQIIAAIPERIKLSPSKGDDMDDSASSGRGRSESHSSLPSQGSPRPSSFGDDSGISTPVTESLAFEEYRYPEFGTPASSLSPESTCLPSPYSPYSFTLDSPPPTTAEFTEYFNAPTTYMEKDFSQLTLSDQEQRKLYEAAKVIQNAYRHYRDKQMQQQKEIEAAVLIQSYYRRYKTYAYYKKMSHAAVLIQNQFRTYYAKRKKRGDSAGTLQVLRRESERLKKGRNQSVIIQQRFRSHYQRRSFDGKEGSGSAQGSGDATNSSPPPPATNCQCPEDPQTVTVDDHVCGFGDGENDGNNSAQDIGTSAEKTLPQ